jgi:hypothetical protein
MPDNKTDDEPGLYPRTRIAFHTLIELEVWTGQLLDAAVRFKDALGRHENREGIWYVPPLDPDDPPDIQKLTEESRSEHHGEFQDLWRAADGWYEFERSFRKVMARAKTAAEAAAAELDSPTTPPLGRTSIAIKRALRDLSGSVPYANTAGWGLGAQEEVITAIRRALQPVRGWTDELRLLVQPEHTLAPPLYFGSPSAFGPTTSPQLPSAAEQLHELPRDPEPETTQEPPSLAVPTSEIGREAISPEREQALIQEEVQETPMPARPTRADRRATLARKGDWEHLARELTPTHRSVLHLVKSQTATSFEDRLTRDYLAGLFQESGRVLRSQNLAEPCAELVDLGLLDSAFGRNGGYWITTAGLAVCTAMQERSAEPGTKAPAGGEPVSPMSKPTAVNAATERVDNSDIPPQSPAGYSSPFG